MAIASLYSPNATFHAIISSDEAFVQLPQFYYDGYVARYEIDGVKGETKGEYVDGLVAFHLPKGEYEIEVRYIAPKSYRIWAPLFYVGFVGVVGLGLSTYVIPAIKKAKQKEEA